MDLCMGPDFFLVIPLKMIDRFSGWKPDDIIIRIGLEVDIRPWQYCSNESQIVSEKRVSFMQNGNFDTYQAITTQRYQEP